MFETTSATVTGAVGSPAICVVKLEPLGIGIVPKPVVFAVVIGVVPVGVAVVPVGVVVVPVAAGVTPAEVFNI